MTLCGSGRKGSALGVFAAIIAAFALGMLPLHAAPFQAEEEPGKVPEKAGGKVTLGLKAKGEVTFDNAKADWSEVSRKLREKVAAAPKEKAGQSEVSKLEVVIRGESGVRWEDAQKAMFACLRQTIRRIYLAHSEVNKGAEMKTWLPVAGARPIPAVTLQEVRVKLLWTEKSSRKETKDREQGHTMLKIKDKYFPFVTDKFGNTAPSYEKLGEFITEAKKNFVPTKSYKTLPVIIDARGLVPFEQVMLALKACRKAGIEDVMFAAPVQEGFTPGDDGELEKELMPKKPGIDEEKQVEKPIEKLEEDHIEKEAPSPSPDEQSEKPITGQGVTGAFGIGGGDKGAYGQRWGKGALAREGGSPGTESAVTAALRWLKNHQDQDGKWDQDGFGKNCDPKQPPACDKPGTGQYDVAVTGLALLAFLGNGHTHRISPYKATVRAGLNWLKNQQKEDGSLGKGAVESWVYNHAIGTAALCEAYAMTKDVILRKAAQKAVDFIVKGQNPGLGWKYKPKSGRSDTSVTGWMVVALKAAKDAKLTVPQSAFDGALKWFDRATNTAGKCGYMRPGDNGSVIRGVNDGFAKLPTMTAVSVYARILCGKSRDDDKVKKGIEILKQSLPEWNKPKNDKVDMYYWYCATCAMFQYGGRDWHTWNEKMKTALLSTQRMGGCADGSWDPVGKWGMVGGRVYSTALNALTLEVYYRYERKNPAKRTSRDEWGKLGKKGAKEEEEDK